jgi:GTP cyclohydrolase IA
MPVALRWHLLSFPLSALTSGAGFSIIFTKGKSMDKIFYSPQEFSKDVKALVQLLAPTRHKYLGIYGVPKGGWPLAIALSNAMNIPLSESPNIDCLIVDDIIDSGATRNRFPDNDFACIHQKAESGYVASGQTFGLKAPFGWIVYFWEGTEEKSIEDSVLRQIQYIGEDASREGLQKTPARVVKAWGKLFEGYSQRPENLLTIFQADGYDQMVLLKDVEFYSTCEHHLISFFGRAHVAYIPGEHIVGISKLARLVDMYARRLQIQERIGEQVTSALMDYLHPKGAACIIEASHLCMRARGVEKQNSVMVTSSLKGVFLTNSEARAELMGLIK